MIVQCALLKCYTIHSTETVESSLCNFIVADPGHGQHPAALQWEAVSIFLENVMSRALTSDKAPDVTDAGTLLLKRLLLVSSTVSWSLPTARSFMFKTWNSGASCWENWVLGCCWLTHNEIFLHFVCKNCVVWGRCSSVYHFKNCQ